MASETGIEFENEKEKGNHHVAHVHKTTKTWLLVVRAGFYVHDFSYEFIPFSDPIEAKEHEDCYNKCIGTQAQCGDLEELINTLRKMQHHDDGKNPTELESKMWGELPINQTADEERLCSGIDCNDV